MQREQVSPSKEKPQNHDVARRPVQVAFHG